MYGYEYGGYGYGCGYPPVAAYPYRGGGGIFALIVVLFILLVIMGAAYVR